MTSKEALSDLYFLAIGEQEHISKCWETIEEDLERLEKCLNVLKLIIRKNVNIVYSKIFDNYEDYSKYFTTYINKNVLTKEEFDLLKEVLENGI